MSSEQLPFQIESNATRVEQDSLGDIAVSKTAYWGAQTQRSLQCFSAGQERMPIEVIYALALLKKAAARTHQTLGCLPPEKVSLISFAVDEILLGKLDSQFPLVIWQTGSGTQTNMNLNEVIAHLANEQAGQPRGAKSPIHPHDDVNMSQSSNDAFPTAMHLAAVAAIEDELIPVLCKFRDHLKDKVLQFGRTLKIGRTHLMDAVPMSFGQEFSGYVEQVEQNLQRLHSALPALKELPLGGTAIGTGLNAPPQFAELCVNEIAALTKRAFVPCRNRFAALAAHDALVHASGVLRSLGISLIKIVNDVRWMASGPHCGLAEISIPANEPGSSIMPGKINPTQCEALLMICMQVIGCDAAIAFAGSQGNFELNVCKPLIISNFLRSAKLLTDGIASFDSHLLQGLVPNAKQLSSNVNNSLMLATALNPHIGYEKATQLAKKATTEGISLRDATIQLQYLTAERFDQIIQAAFNLGDLP